MTAEETAAAEAAAETKRLADLAATKAANDAATAALDKLLKELEDKPDGENKNVAWLKDNWLLLALAAGALLWFSKSK